MIDVDDIIGLVIPKDNPEIAGSYSMKSGPIAHHVLHIGLAQGVVFELFQYFSDSLFDFLRKAI
jgi:hypothetical protein